MITCDILDDSALDAYYDSIIHKIENLEDLEYKINDLSYYDELYNEMYDTRESLPKKNSTKKPTLETCQNCPTTVLMEDFANGIVLCKGCGCVLYNIMDAGLDWMNYNDDNGKVSTNGYTTINVLLPNASMSSVIKGKCNGSIRTIHSRNYIQYEEKRMSNFFKMIQQKCHEAKIPKCIEDDIKIFMNNLIKVEEHECKNLKFRADNLLGMIQACMYFACKKNGSPFTPKEISDIWNSEIGCTTKGIKNFAKIAKSKNIIDIEQSMTPEQFIKRFCKKLQIKQQYINDSLLVAENVLKLQIADEHAPVSIAIGSIFLAMQINHLNITKKFLAKQFNISVVTITKTFKKFLPFKKILLNTEICNKLQSMVTEYKNDITISDKIIPNFVRFGVTPPQCNTFNIMVKVENKIYIKNELLDGIVEESEKAMKRQTYIMNKTFAQIEELQNKPEPRNVFDECDKEYLLEKTI